MVMHVVLLRNELDKFKFNLKSENLETNSSIWKKKHRLRIHVTK